MPASQRIVQICLSLMAAIALFGGALQMSLGQPDTTPRLDNVHRFLAGIYLGCGFIAAWAAITVRRQGVLVYLIALAVFIAAIGRLISMAKVGLPEPHALWLAYVISELVIPAVMAAGQYATQRK
jgi:ABC-type Fe3+-siderophore transport system permease subunit